MSKVTGVTLAAYVADKPDPNATFGKILLDNNAVQTTLAAADSVERAYETADANFRSMEAAKAAELDRSIVSLNLADPAQHRADAMREWRRSAIKQFDGLAIEHFRAAQNLLDVCRVTEEYNKHGAVNLAGRHGLLGDTSKYREAWERVNGAGAMEVRTIAAVAMASKNRDLAAACIRRIQQMDKKDRDAVGITHGRLADAAFGEDFKQIAHSLGVIREKANHIIARYRSRMAGSDGESSATSKISRGLAAMQRGATPAEPSSPQPLGDPATGRYRLPKDVVEIMKAQDARAAAEGGTQ